MLSSRRSWAWQVYSRVELCVSLSLSLFLWWALWHTLCGSNIGPPYRGQGVSPRGVVEQPTWLLCQDLELVKPVVVGAAGSGWSCWLSARFLRRHQSHQEAIVSFRGRLACFGPKRKILLLMFWEIYGQSMLCQQFKILEVESSRVWPYRGGVQFLLACGFLPKEEK